MSCKNIKFYFSSIAFVLTLFSICSSAVLAQSLLENKWRVTIQTGQFGPIETILEFRNQGGKIYGYSVSGSREFIAKLPKAKNQKVQIDKHLFAFSLKQNAEKYEGEMIAPWANGKISLDLNEKGFEGKIKGGRFNGDFTGVLFDKKEKSLRNYPAIVESFLKTVRAKAFNPRALKESAWKTLKNNMKEIGDSAKDDCDVLLGFHFAYEGKPFSHLTFARGRMPANQLMAQLDNFRVGGKPASVKFDGDIAILSVKTMMGVDTIELIEAAFKEIDKKSPKSVIIDLRGNGGGAFAIKPLIEHIIDEPLDAGYFVTHKWNLKNKRLPTKKELFAVNPWRGFSLKAWWENVQSESIIRLRFEPRKPNYDGPIFVLIDSQSASATEMAIDALSTSDSVTLIGEKTSGEVLSQSPFDILDGFQAFIPVADYYSFANGRIEGIGIKPQVDAKSADALSIAKKLSQKAMTKANK